MIDLRNKMIAMLMVVMFVSVLFSSYASVEGLEGKTEKDIITTAQL